MFYKPDEVFTDVVGSAYYVAPEVSSAPVLCMAGAATVFWALLQEQKHCVHAIAASNLPGMSAPQPQGLTACAEMTPVSMRQCGVSAFSAVTNAPKPSFP